MRRILVLQPAVPNYRVPLFDRISEVRPLMRVLSSVGGLTHLPAHTPEWFVPLGEVKRIFPGLQWQRGAVQMPIRRGDVVIVSGAPRCLSNLVVLCKATSRGAHTCWWGHYWSATSRPWRAKFRYMLMSLAGTLLFYTEQEVKEYQEHWGKRANPRTFALNNGIETSDIIRLRTSYDALRRGSVILFIGRLTEKARLPLLIDTLALPECSGISVEVIGTGDREQELRRRAEAAGVAERIRWHGGVLDEARIAEVANRCSLFVYPGAVGLSLIHALAYGLPAVVHSDRRRQMPEFSALQDGVNGLLFESGNVRSLAATINSALCDLDRLSRMSASAIRTTTESFNAQDMARRFEAAIVAASAG